jgi:hypothetical protein
MLLPPSRRGAGSPPEEREGAQCRGVRMRCRWAARKLRSRRCASPHRSTRAPHRAGCHGPTQWRGKEEPEEGTTAWCPPRHWPARLFHTTRTLAARTAEMADNGGASSATLRTRGYAPAPREGETTQAPWSLPRAPSSWARAGPRRPNSFALPRDAAFHCGVRCPSMLEAYGGRGRGRGIAKCHGSSRDYCNDGPAKG